MRHCLRKSNISWLYYRKTVSSLFRWAIPLYYGDEEPNALQEITRKAIIYAKDFKNDEDLVEYIKQVDNDDRLYCEIWDQNIIPMLDAAYEESVKRLSKKLYEVIDHKLFNNNPRNK